MSQCIMAYKGVITKLRDRMPVEAFEVMKNFTSVNPRFMVNHPNQTVLRFEELLLYLAEKRIVKTDYADELMSQ